MVFAKVNPETGILEIQPRGVDIPGLFRPAGGAITQVKQNELQGEFKTSDVPLLPVGIGTLAIVGIILFLVLRK